MVCPSSEGVANGPSGGTAQENDEVSNKNPQEKTSEARMRDPNSQAGSYSIEMLLMSRVHV